MGFTNKFVGFHEYKKGPGLPVAEPYNVVDEAVVIVWLVPAYAIGIGFTVTTTLFCLKQPVDVFVSFKV